MADILLEPARLAKTIFTAVLLLELVNPSQTFGQTMDTRSPQTQTVDWVLSTLLDTPFDGQSIVGEPHVVPCPYGKAVHFNGSTDGIFLNTNPLIDLRQFTVEAVICPDPKSEFEQRFLHLGEVEADRVLLELRMTENDQWYLDAYIRSDNSFQPLIDKTLLHPAGQWYQVAFVVDGGKTSTYVNGKHELDGQIVLKPFKSGRTSIGVRMNKRSWFKGAIYRIRITPRCLGPADFITP